MDPYREENLIQEKPVHKNVYRYTLHSNHECPVCRHSTDQILRYNGNYPDTQYGERVYCHPLKRLRVRGYWWWAKYCPVNGLHMHCYCRNCSIQWIYMCENQTGANPEIKEAYL